MPSRTTLNDFQEATEAISTLLTKYSDKKDSGPTAKWITQGVDIQALHMRGHLDTVSQILRPMPMEAFNFEEFVSLSCRALMLLQHAVLKYPEEYKRWKSEAKTKNTTRD